MPNIPYQRESAINYAITYGNIPNQKYIYFNGNDCTNYVSQCLKAGGARNHYHPTHPWWYLGNQASICWSVAASLYWYIRVCTKENQAGIKAKTIAISGDGKYSVDISQFLEIGDIIQYRNNENRIQHSAIITGFERDENNIKQPLISQHTFEAVNIPWKKNFKETIFHHITSIN